MASPLVQKKVDSSHCTFSPLLPGFRSLGARSFKPLPKMTCAPRTHGVSTRAKKELAPESQIPLMYVL